MWVVELLLIIFMGWSNTSPPTKHFCPLILVLTTRYQIAGPSQWSRDYLRCCICVWIHWIHTPHTVAAPTMHTCKDTNTNAHTETHTHIHRHTQTHSLKLPQTMPIVVSDKLEVVYEGKGLWKSLFTMFVAWNPFDLHLRQVWVYA